MGARKGGAGDLPSPALYFPHCSSVCLRDPRKETELRWGKMCTFRAVSEVEECLSASWLGMGPQKEAIHSQEVRAFQGGGNSVVVENKDNQKKTTRVRFLDGPSVSTSSCFTLTLFSSFSLTWNLDVTFNTAGTYLSRYSHFFFKAVFSQIGRCLSV